MNAAVRALRNPIGCAILLVVLVLACTSIFTIVPETAQALVVRMGQPLRVVNRYHAGARYGDDGAGLIAHLPLVEQVYMIDKRVRDLDVEHQPVLTANDQQYEIDAFARYRIVDPLRMYLAAQGDQKRVVDALTPVLGSALRTEFARRPSAAFPTPDRDAALRAIRDDLDRAARQYGARIADVRIERVVLPDGTPLDGAYERMRAARQQQAMAIRADGMKQAAAIRGQADADAARIYADSFGKDPDFYDFYRSMQSYRSTFGVDEPTDGGTTIVLPTDSAYLRNFAGGRTK